MAFALRSNHGNTVSKAAGTLFQTHTVTTANVLAGDLAILYVGTDNLTTTDGVTNDHTSVTDSSSNEWRKAYEFTNGNGTAATGATASLWWCLVKTALVSGVGTVTVNYSGSITDKTLAVGSYSYDTTGTVGLVDRAGAVQDASTNGPSTTLSGLASRPYLLMVSDAFEATQTGFTLGQDVDYTTEANNGTTGGAAGADMKLLGSRRIATLTTDTHLATTALTVDSAGVIAAFAEQPWTLFADLLFDSDWHFADEDDDWYSGGDRVDMAGVIIATQTPTSEPVETFAAQPHYGEADLTPPDEPIEESDSSLDVSAVALTIPDAPLETYASQPHYGEWLWDADATEDFTPLPDDGWMAGAGVLLAGEETLGAQPHYGEWLWDLDAPETELVNDAALDTSAVASTIPEAPFETHLAQFIAEVPEYPEDWIPEAQADDFAWIATLGLAPVEPDETFAAQFIGDDPDFPAEDFYDPMTDDGWMGAVVDPAASDEALAAQVPFDLYVAEDDAQPPETIDGLDWYAGIFQGEPTETFAAQFTADDPDFPDDEQPATWLDDMAWLAALNNTIALAAQPATADWLEDDPAPFHLQPLDDHYIAVLNPPAPVTEVFIIQLNGTWRPMIVGRGAHAPTFALGGAHRPTTQSKGAHAPTAAMSGTWLP